MATAGQRIGEYVLHEVIGRGTFGEVWLGRHHAWTDRLVAVKMPTEPLYIRQLQAEGATVHRLRHPNIVRSLNFDPFGDPPYLVMEYVPGCSLRRPVKERLLSVEQSVQMMLQLLAGLQFAHSKGVIHQDIKPENVLVHQAAFTRGFALAGAVKLTDFGLGRVAQNVNSILLTRSVVTGASGGTPRYMAPEQMDGAAADARADLYACAIVLFEMLTGKVPAGSDLPGELNEQVPPWLDEIFRAVFTRLERRLGSAAEMADLLRAGLAEFEVGRISSYAATPGAHVVNDGGAVKAVDTSAVLQDLAVAVSDSPRRTRQQVSPSSSPPPLGGYYVQQGAMRVGPLPLEGMGDIHIERDTMVWRTGMSEWRQAQTLPELAPLIRPASVPPSLPTQHFTHHPHATTGSPYQQARPGPGTDNRRIVAAIMAILFGALGVHKFVLGMAGPGLIMLLVTVLTCGWAAPIVALIGLIEGIIYLTTSDAAFHARYTIGRRAWF
jgi:serine/threonine protein kinase/TM2 domain-containing membrane protein YozV